MHSVEKQNRVNSMNSPIFSVPISPLSPPPPPKVAFLLTHVETLSVEREVCLKEYSPSNT